LNLHFHFYVFPGCAIIGSSPFASEMDQTFSEDPETTPDYIGTFLGWFFLLPLLSWTDSDFPF